MIDYDLTNTAKVRNELETMLCEYWKNIAINIFEWRRKSGLPLSTIADGLESRHIETYLYDNGRCSFFKDEYVGYLTLPINDGARRNIYNDAVNFTAVGLGKTFKINIDNAVIINNNALKTTPKKLIEHYVATMVDIELTKKLNRDACKTPIAIETDEKTLLSSKNYYKKIAACEPVIYKNRGHSDLGKALNAVDMGVEFIADKLEDDYHNYEARILTLLGLDNYVEDKAERVQSAEVNAQQEYIISSFRASLRSRQEACEKINEMFGLDLEVGYVSGNEIEEDEEPTEETTDEPIEDKGVDDAK